MQAPNVENQSEIHHMKFMQVVLYNFQRIQKLSVPVKPNMHRKSKNIIQLLCVCVCSVNKILAS